MADSRILGETMVDQWFLGWPVTSDFPKKSACQVGIFRDVFEAYSSLALDRWLAPTNEQNERFRTD